MNMMMPGPERAAADAAAVDVAIARLSEAGYTAWDGGQGEYSPYVAISTVDINMILDELAALREPQSTTLIVSQEGQTIARVENYRGPVPAVGQYLLHPLPGDNGTTDSIQARGMTSGRVSQVILGIYARPQHGEKHFTGRALNIVEVTI